jgi:uncharacterized protein involved in tolerance to divalent cations
VTVPRDVAVELARALVGERRAACANLADEEDVYGPYIAWARPGVR